MGQAVSPAIAVRKRSAATDRPLQQAALDPGRSAAAAQQMHAVARRGVSGSAGGYPYSNLISEAFGRYTPPALSAHAGPAAREAGAALNAEAFVWNGKAAFAGRPTLRTAAHEAAHMVHQAAGVDLRHGVGARGDGGERLADRVADTLSAGRSAEPVFEAALGPEVSFGGAAPALQMSMNAIVDYHGPEADTPWTEIQEQLPVRDGVLKAQITAMNSNRYGNMLEVLEDRCDRAEHVKADIAGTRPGSGEKRKGNLMQTAYGALGSFMEEVVGTTGPAGTPASKDLAFEGGHLISDEILGKDSYVGYNFAPQRSHINSPVYRSIEKIAAEGITLKDPLKGPSATPPKPTMLVKVTYPPGKLKIPTKDLMARLDIDDTDLDLTKKDKPTDVELTRRVPYLWSADIDTGSTDYVFAHEMSVDTEGENDALSSNRKGAARGFLSDKDDFDKRADEALTHRNANLWWMDTMKHEVPSISETAVGTGSDSDRTDKHSFLAAQSAPDARSMLGSVAVASSSPVASAPVTLKRKYSFHEVNSIAPHSAKKIAKYFRKDEPALVGAPVNSLNAAAQQIQKIKNDRNSGILEPLSYYVKAATKDKNLGTQDTRLKAGKFVRVMYRHMTNNRTSVSSLP